MYDDYTEIRQQLYRWLCFMPNKVHSYNSIRQLALRLLHQFHPDKESISHNGAWYRIFSPLLRSGVVCFRGQGTYSLSRPCYLVGHGRAIAVNLTACGEHTSYLPGIAVVAAELPGELAGTYPIQAFSLRQQLGKLPTIRQIAAGWPTVRIPVAGKIAWHRWTPLGWKPYLQGLPQQPGYYREGSESFGNTYFISDAGGSALAPPAPSVQPEAATVARLLTRAYEQQLDRFWVTQQEESCIVADNVYFPAELEKLLFYNALLEGELPMLAEPVRHYSLRGYALAQFSRIFGKSIYDSQL